MRAIESYVGKDFCDFIDETVETIRDLHIDCDAKQALQNAIWSSWSGDSQDRRNAFSGGFAEFQQHVLNVLDAYQDA